MKALLQWLFGKKTLFGARSRGWGQVRKAHLETHPTCAACGAAKELDVHHILPVHLFPELELDARNLITLCGGKRNCHWAIGHGFDWKAYRPRVRALSAKILAEAVSRTRPLVALVVFVSFGWGQAAQEKAIVSLYCVDNTVVSRGSGVVVNRAGHLLGVTAYHVVANEKPVHEFKAYSLWDRRWHVCTYVRGDQKDDWAVFSGIPAGHPAFRLIESRPRVGASMRAIGYAGGTKYTDYQWKLAEHRSVHFWADGRAIPGMSGGAVLVGGRLAGIISATSVAPFEGFSVGVEFDIIH